MTLYRTAFSRVALWVSCIVALTTISACAAENGQPSARADTNDAATPNVLTSAEQEAGWVLLFDGESFDGWRGLGREDVPSGHWQIEDGTIRKVASGDVPTAPDGQPLEGGDVMTEATFRDFELMFEWKLAEGANSGIKYNVSESLSTAHDPRHAALGFEYQVLDDGRHPDGEIPSHRAGALYDMIVPNAAKRLRPVGEWNQSRIILRGSHGEHWLNGEKIVEYDVDSPRFDSLLTASKYGDIDGFADRRNGHIVIQDHSDDAWFRNIKIIEFPEQ